MMVKRQRPVHISSDKAWQGPFTMCGRLLRSVDYVDPTEPHFATCNQCRSINARREAA
jgi:hypothetical protein